MITKNALLKVLYQLDRCLQLLHDAVLEQVPTLQWTHGHYEGHDGSSTAYASFYKPRSTFVEGEDESVDIVVSYHNSDQGTRFLADVSWQRGSVLAELPEVLVSSESQHSDDVSLIPSEIGAFIEQQSELIIHELTELS